MEADSALTTAPEEITCRICWAEEGTEPTLGTLISPCLCSGNYREVEQALSLLHLLSYNHSPETNYSKFLGH